MGVHSALQLYGVIFIQKHYVYRKQHNKNEIIFWKNTQLVNQGMFISKNAILLLLVLKM